MTFQSPNCKQCGKRFSFTAKPCNHCKKVIPSVCWDCHKVEHKYNLSNEHGYTKSRYIQMLASFTLLTAGTIQIVFYLGEIRV